MVPQAGVEPATHGLTNPDGCSCFIGDSGMATTLPHGLGGPKVNRSAAPSLRQTFYHIIRDTRSKLLLKRHIYQRPPDFAILQVI
jgi:hypothetical protein